MMVNELAAVTAALSGLRHAGSPGLERRVFTGWVSAPSRLGEVFVAFTGDGVQFVRSAESVGGDPATFADTYRRRFARPLRPADRGPAGLLPSLRGRRGAAARLDLSSLTAFERDVLTVTRSIPTGETRPYSWVAREAGHPTAVRAVASVLGRNPVPLLVPCHRVVRSDGSPGGYMSARHGRTSCCRARARTSTTSPTSPDTACTTWAATPPASSAFPPATTPAASPRRTGPGSPRSATLSPPGIGPVGHAAPP